MAKPSDDNVARANRVRSLRKMTQYSRNEFQKRFGIAAGTLQHWEDAQKNGLSLKGAKRLAQVLKQAGIYCTAEWLVHGKGPGPQRLPNADENLINPSEKLFSVQENQEIESIASELAVFTQHYPEVINTVVTDDAMEPRFTAGEYVAGVRRYKQAINALVGLDCIVVTTEGELLIRRIKAMEAPGFYTLSCLNLNTTIPRPVLYNVELVSAAPIIWARRIYR
jgi:transcriptional regulator with XRE-family HTH domain